VILRLAILFAMWSGSAFAQITTPPPPPVYKQKFETGPDQQVLIRGSIDLSAGSSMTCTNAANDALQPCEFLSSGVWFNSPIYARGFVLPDYRIADLPACNSGTRFMVVAVNDLARPPGHPFSLASPVYGDLVEAAAGGGRIAWPVFCDGMNWTVH
jgi:hypothetical protein